MSKQKRPGRDFLLLRGEFLTGLGKRRHGPRDLALSESAKSAVQPREEIAGVEMKRGGERGLEHLQNHALVGGEDDSGVLERRHDQGIFQTQVHVKEKRLGGKLFLPTPSISLEREERISFPPEMGV